MYCIITKDPSWSQSLSQKTEGLGKRKFEATNVLHYPAIIADLTLDKKERWSSMPRTKEKVLGYYIKHDKDRKLFNKRSWATSTNQSQREKLLFTVLQREQGREM